MRVNLLCTQARMYIIIWNWRSWTWPNIVIIRRKNSNADQCKWVSRAWVKFTRHTRCFLLLQFLEVTYHMLWLVRSKSGRIFGPLRTAATLNWVMRFMMSHYLLQLCSAIRRHVFVSLQLGYISSFPSPEQISESFFFIRMLWFFFVQQENIRIIMQCFGIIMNQHLQSWEYNCNHVNFV